MKRQNNLYTFNWRFLSSSLQTNPSFIPITNVRFVSDSSQNNPLFAPIPVNYIASKEKPLNVYFSLIEMYNFVQFCTKIKSIIEWNTKYTVYIKVRYRIDNYFMAGNQFGFSYESDNSLDDLYTTTRYKLEDYFKDYFLEDVDVVYVQISFRKNNLKLLADFRKDIEWDKGDPVGNGGASIFRKSTYGLDKI